MSDSNYPPGDFADRTGEAHGPLFLAPPRLGEDYDDIFKVSNCTSCVFTDITVSAGRQRENALDLNRGSSGNRFSNLRLDGGGQGAILIKGGSSNNFFENVLIYKTSGHSDVMVGGYSQQSQKASTNNRFAGIRREDGKPIRVAWTFTRAKKPIFTNSDVEYQYFWSLVRTVAMELKYLFG